MTRPVVGASSASPPGGARRSTSTRVRPTRESPEHLMAAMKSLNLKTLRIFETVATCGGFSRAAEQLEMTQPAVSMHIRQLEDDLGTALFDRQHRQRLTDAGRELLQHARLIGAQVHAAEASLLAYS